jgi:hypothetical protein
VACLHQTLGGRSGRLLTHSSTTTRTRTHNPKTPKLKPRGVAIGREMGVVLPSDLTQHRGLAPDDPSHTRFRLRGRQTQCLPLPFVIKPFADELLSSWMRRVGQEYGVSLQQVARHVGLSMSRPTDIDHRLQADDVSRLAVTLRVERREIRDRLLHPLLSPVRSLRSSRTPIQTCTACQREHRSARATAVILRAWFEFWSIECRACQLLLSSFGPPVLDRCNPVREHLDWFNDIMPAARRGAARLHAFARRPDGTNLSPVAVLNLLSKPLAPSWRQGAPVWQEPHRVADLFVPGLAELTRDVGVLIPDAWAPGRPVRLVTARTILFASLASFLDNPGRSMHRIRAAGPFSPGSILDQWISALPPHTRSAIAASQQNLARSEIAANSGLAHATIRD